MNEPLDPNVPLASQPLWYQLQYRANEIREELGANTDADLMELASQALNPQSD